MRWSDVVGAVGVVVVLLAGSAFGGCDNVVVLLLYSVIDVGTVVMCFPRVFGRSCKSSGSWQLMQFFVTRAETFRASTSSSAVDMGSASVSRSLFCHVFL